MKKILLSAITLLCAVHTSFAADIYVNNSGQPGTWSTITLALAAAAPNDRIFVSPYGAYTENLNIVQNVTLTSAVSGTVFNLVGSITINGNANMDVRIIGCEASGGITCNTGAATLTNKANIYLSDCKFSTITGNDYCVMHVLYCYNTNITIRHGEIRGCTEGIGTITIPDGPNAGVGDTLFIVGNSCTRINWQNNDNYFYISNNLVKAPGTVVSGTYAVYVTNHHYSTVNNNLFINNTFQNNYSGTATDYGATVYFTTTSNRANIQWWNNLVSNLYNSGTYSYCNYITGGSGTMQAYYNYFDSPVITIANTVGNVIGTYNTPMAAFDEYGRATDANGINQGSPNLNNYDIDMTRNDRGTFGGPYSMDNYINTADGKARVYDLNMPFEIWSGSTPQVKAEATHIK